MRAGYNGLASRYIDAVVVGKRVKAARQVQRPVPRADGKGNPVGGIGQDGKA